MKRPLLAITIVYAAGLLLADFCCAPLPCVFGMALLLCLAALALSRMRYWLMWPLVFLTGWTNLAYRTSPLSPDDLRHSQGDAPQLVTVRGVLDETPTERVRHNNQHESFRFLATVSVTSISKPKEDWQPASGKIIVTTPGILPREYFAGKTIEATGVLARPPGAFAEGMFDYRLHLQRAGIYFQLKTESTNDWRVLPDDKKRPLADRFLDWAQKTLARGLPEQDEVLKLLWAMTLGWKTGLTSEVSEPFMRSGTMHIFAISGLHIAFIATILVSLLKVVRVPRRISGIIVIPLLWFYTGATGWQPSAIRSAVMMTIIIAGWIFKRPSDLLNSLAAAALVILLWDPQALFSASFQLSFFVVLSIALFQPCLAQLLHFELGADPFLPPSLIPRWKQWLNRPAKWLQLSFSTSLAAWLGALPLTACYFHLFSPTTLLANLFIIPISSLALGCNLGSLICGSWLPLLTELFNYSAWFWMKSMLNISYWATLWPGAYVYVKTPSTVDLVLYLIAVAALLAALTWAGTRRIWAVAVIAASLTLLVSKAFLPAGYVELTCLPLNGGMAVFIDSGKKAEQLLVDTGNSNAVQFVTCPFLYSHGVNGLSHVALTHGDLKHIGGSQNLAAALPIRRVYASTLRFRSSAWRNALEHFSAARTLHKLNPNDQVAGWTVLHPAADYRAQRADDGALVLSKTIKGVRVLLVSDLSRAGQNHLLESGLNLKADVVVTGLAGDGTTLTDTFLDSIAPALIVVCDSENPASECARPELGDRLRSRCGQVIFTHETGAAAIRFRKCTWELRTMKQSEVLSTRSAKTPNYDSEPGTTTTRPASENSSK